MFIENIEGGMGGGGGVEQGAPSIILFYTRGSGNKPNYLIIHSLPNNI